jgi:hypothetical protein
VRFESERKTKSYESVFSSATAQEEDHDEHHYFEEIIVSAMPLRRTVEELAQPASVLEGDKLARQQSTSIGESLATELGVTSARSHRARSFAASTVNGLRS